MHKLDDDTEAPALPRPPFDKKTSEPPTADDHTEP
jgi:hypothetical protein